jgi:hypothetical protein
MHKSRENDSDKNKYYITSVSHPKPRKRWRRSKKTWQERNSGPLKNIPNSDTSASHSWHPLTPTLLRVQIGSLSPCVSTPGITPSNIISTISERIIFSALQQSITVLRITVGLSTSIVGGKLSAVVRRNERLIDSMSVRTWRGTLGRRESDVLLLWVHPERILVLKAEGIGSAGWVLQLPVVTEDNEEEESGDTDLNEEGENVTPRTPIPGIITPCRRRELVRYHCPPRKEAYIVQHQIDSAWCS